MVVALCIDLELFDALGCGAFNAVFVTSILQDWAQPLNLIYDSRCMYVKDDPYLK